MKSYEFAEWAPATDYTQKSAASAKNILYVFKCLPLQGPNAELVEVEMVRL